MQRLFKAREFGLVLSILAVLALIAALGKAHDFLGGSNLSNVLRQIALLGVFAIGETVVIVGGGIDLSVGSVICICGMLSAMLIRYLAGDLASGSALPAGVLLAGLLAAVAAGLVVGLFHALLVTRLDLPPFIATLATLAGLRSAAQLITNSAPVPLNYSNFLVLAKGPYPVAFFVAVALLVGALMRATTLGRGLRAMGGNEEAARLSGLTTARLKYLAYGLSGMLAGLAGLLYASYSGQGDPRTATGYELQAIAASVVGGCSLSGGVGSVSGTVLGVILLQVVLNGIGLVVKSNSTLWQGIVTGVVVVLAVTLNNWRQARQARAAR